MRCGERKKKEKEQKEKTCFLIVQWVVCLFCLSVSLSVSSLSYLSFTFLHQHIVQRVVCCLVKKEEEQSDGEAKAENDGAL